MKTYTFEPWPSTYVMGKAVEPHRLVANCEGRKVGAFKSMIPPLTVEPPQVHLIAARDKHEFQELIVPEKRMHVAYFDVKSMTYRTQEYDAGKWVVIPAFQIHWLINPNKSSLRFVCEYSPCPWDGDNDEPEFPNLRELMKFVKRKGLMGRLV